MQQLDSVQASIGSELAPGTSLLVQLGGSRRTDRLDLNSDESLIDGPSGVPLDLSTDRERSVKTGGGSVLALLSHDIGILRLTAGGSFSRTRVDTSAEDAFTGVFDLGFTTVTGHEEHEARRHAHAELTYLTAAAMLDLSPTTVWVGVEHVTRTRSTRLGAATGPAAGPDANPIATARFSRTTAVGSRRTSASYSVAIRAQSVSSAVRAWA